MSGLYLSYRETSDVRTSHKDSLGPECCHEVYPGLIEQVQGHC